jgi:hypothetical protein
MFRFAVVIVALAVISTDVSARAHPASGGVAKDNVAHLQNFQVFEFRRYVIKQGERKNFARYFDAYFPEALEQSGAIAAGQFLERGNHHFTWIRGFHAVEDRAIANAKLYYGPLWKEHAAQMNSLMIDSDNVLLLRPLHPEHGLGILPAVDPVKEKEGAKGVVVAQIFAIKPGNEKAFSSLAETAFARYRIAGVREAGVLVTLDVPNNFPQLPIRTDGPYLVWLGIIKDDRTLEKRFRPLAKSVLHTLTGSDLLRSAPEFVVMDPTSRSRMRWLGKWQ